MILQYINSYCTLYTTVHNTILESEWQHLMMACSDSITVKFNTVDAGVNGSSTIGAAFLLGLLVAERLAWWVCEGGGGRGEEVRMGIREEIITVKKA